MVKSRSIMDRYWGILCNILASSIRLSGKRALVCGHLNITSLLDEGHEQTVWILDPCQAGPHPSEYQLKLDCRC